MRLAAVTDVLWLGGGVIVPRLTDPTQNNSS